MGKQPKKDNAIAYCHSKQHQGFMSENIIKAHGCLRKNCPYLEKYENMQYWKDRAKKKADKKARKNSDSPKMTTSVA